MDTQQEFSSDIPVEAARNAHAWNSFDLEKRGEQVRTEYAGTLAQDHEMLAKYADTDGKRAALETEFARYRAGYRQRYLAMLAARARCPSWMVTGRSNFPTRRAEKANAVERKRAEELIEYRTRALAAIVRVLRPEQAPIMLGDANAAERIESKLEALERKQELMRLSNAAIRKHAKEGPEVQVAALVALGHHERIARELLEPDFAGRIGYADYELTNNGAQIRRLKGRAETVERIQAMPETSAEGAHARLEDAPAENRVRLYFPGKPAVEIRETLKSRGFRWTPSLGCWQAYRNTGSIETAKTIAGIL